MENENLRAKNAFQYNILLADGKGLDGVVELNLGARLEVRGA